MYAFGSFIIDFLHDLVQLNECAFQLRDVEKQCTQPTLHGRVARVASKCSQEIHACLLRDISENSAIALSTCVCPTRHLETHRGCPFPRLPQNRRPAGVGNFSNPIWRVPDERERRNAHASKYYGENEDWLQNITFSHENQPLRQLPSSTYCLVAPVSQIPVIIEISTQLAIRNFSCWENKFCARIGSLLPVAGAALLGTCWIGSTRAAMHRAPPKN